MAERVKDQAGHGWLRAVFFRWWVLMGTAAITVLGLVNRAWSGDDVVDPQTRVVHHDPFFSNWVFGGAVILLLFVACYMAWADAITKGKNATATVSTQRDGLQAVLDEQEKVSLVVDLRQIEPVDQHVFKLSLSVTNNGPDSDFVAIIQEIFGVPSYLPRPYGDLKMAWEGSSSPAQRIYRGNKGVLVVGHWLHDRYHFMFRVANDHGPLVDGIQFAPAVTTLEFDLDVRDIERKVGRMFHVAIDFTDPESRMPTDMRVAPVEASVA